MPDTLNYIESSRQDIRAALEGRDGSDCFYCGCELDLENRTIDHVVSQREGKRRGWELESIHGLDNLRLACRTCNGLKGDRMLNEDGTIPPRPLSRKAKKIIKASRPEVCKTCMSGRKLRVDETCPVCYSGAQPGKFPTYYKSDPKECEHGWGESLEHCWCCVVAFPWLRKTTSDARSAEELVSGG